MTDKPTPGPLCEEKPTINIGGPGDMAWYIACDESDDHTVSVQHSGTRKDAIARWNARPVEGALADALEAILADHLTRPGETEPTRVIAMNFARRAIKKAGRA